MPVFGSGQRHWAETLLGCLLQDIIHTDAQMALVIDAFSITNDQDLGRLMMDLEAFRYLIGNRAIRNEVEVVKIDVPWLRTSFQPAFDQGTGAAAGTVLEDHLRPFSGLLTDLI